MLKRFQNPGVSVAVVCIFMMSGCGGGGSSTATDPAPLTSQQTYESFVLAQNGGEHYLNAKLALSVSGSGTVTVDPSQSYFFTGDLSLPQSPGVAGPEMLTAGFTSLSAALTVPTGSGGRFLINGTVVVAAVPFKSQISYSGGNVQDTQFATDGTTVVQTFLGTSYVAVPLSGAISNSPTELFQGSALGVITNTLNGQSLYDTSATWQTGAAYMKATRHMVGDTVSVGDCTTPATTGTSITPCSTTISVLENFFPYTSTTDNTTYNLSDGQIVTLAGVRAWVATAPTSSVTTTYRVYYQSAGEIFSGVLIRDGTILNTTLLGTNTPQSFAIYLNSAAVQSIKSAIKF